MWYNVKFCIRYFSLSCHATLAGAFSGVSDGNKGKKIIIIIQINPSSKNAMPNQEEEKIH